MNEIRKGAITVVSSRTTVKSAGSAPPSPARRPTVTPLTGHWDGTSS